MLLKLTLCISIFAAASSSVPSCVPRDYGYGSPVCVCNSTYCDLVEPTTVDQLAGGVVRHYVSTKTGKRLELTTTKFSSASQQGNATTFEVNRKARYQEMFGFGGAATDSATMNTYALSSAAAEKLIRSYFAEEGIGYTFIRVPMGGADFSTHEYTYDDHPYDTSLEHFNLTVEDYNYKIPFIKRAKQVSPSEVKLFTAPWTLPKWMDKSKNSNEERILKEEYYQVFANYNAKFLDFYAAEGLAFWGLAPRNEPGFNAGAGPLKSGLSYPQLMQNYLAANLCPTLKAAGYTKLNVMVSDDMRTTVPFWVQIYKNQTVHDCVSGMAVHWYEDDNTSPEVLTQAHEQNPEKFILYTEACVMHSRHDPPVTLGSWEKGARYIADIIQVTNHWVTGWVDWNVALDPDGGPNWINNTVDAPVIVNATADEFYKQPMFYALAHFSKFVPPGSVHIGLESQQDSGIENVAFLAPNNITVVILHNKADKDVEVVLNDPDSGSVTLEIPAFSMHTVLFK